ncbi:MAG: glycosyltransferase [Bacteroidota bacterium]|nr:glycosyltransferase [Bacteroidota bacterium]
MSLLLTILLAYAAGFIGLQVLFLVSVFLMENVKPKTQNHEPFISILIAARNEEKSISYCLQSIIEMDYPPNKMELLIGNDNSTDNTAKLVQEIIAQNNDKFTIKLYHISEQMGKAKAKANVLAELAHHAHGEYFFVTDADIVVNKNWAKTILNSFTNKIGIVSGTTIIKNKPQRRTTLQKYDWLYFSSLLKAISNLGIPVTAVGNNMAVKREAYFATGGYENINFSVTEDLALYNAVRKQGYDSLNLMDRGSLNFTNPTTHIQTLFNQRKRWLKGANDLNIIAKLILFYHGLYPFMLLFFCIINWKLGILFLCIKYMIQNIHIIALSKYLKQPCNYIQLLVYEFLQIFFNLTLAIYYILPIKYLWKGREY